MGIVDSVLKNWAKDLVKLENAIKAEGAKIASNDKQITALSQANSNSQYEINRANSVINNLKSILAAPVDG